MSKVYTSYYAKIGGFDPKEFLRIKISNGCPTKDLIDLAFPPIIPSYDLVERSKAGEINHDQYAKEYRSQLDAYGYDKLAEQFVKLQTATEKILVLFCYESPEKWCHRHVFASWFNLYAGDQIITEYVFQ